MRAAARLGAFVLAVVLAAAGAARGLDASPFRFVHGHEAAVRPQGLGGGVESYAGWTGPLRHKEAREEAGQTTLALVLALRQQNVDRLDRAFWEVSDPAGPGYGRHLSFEQVTEMVAPPRQHVKAVVDWLAQAAPCGARAQLSAGRDLVRVACTVTEAELLLGAEFGLFVHRDSGRTAWRTVSPMTAVPAHVAELVDFVGGANTPLVSVDARAVRSESAAGPEEADESAPHNASAAVYSTVGGVGAVTVTFNPLCADGTPNTDVSPAAACSSNQMGDPLLSVAVEVSWAQFGFLSASFSAGGFPCAEASRTLPNGTAYTRVECQVVVGGGGLPLYTPLSVSLTSRYGLGAGAPTQPAPVVCKEFVTPQWLRDLYSIPRGLAVQQEGNSAAVAEFLSQYFNPDDLARYLYDNAVPDARFSHVVGPNNATEGSVTGGEAQLDVQVLAGLASGTDLWFWSVPGNNSYNHEEPWLEWLMAVAAEDGGRPIRVWSISYGDTESSLPRSYTDRLNVEFRKLGVMGVTLLVSSGDDGSASYLGRTNSSACNRNHPEFPATSPFITSVGATQLSVNHHPVCLQRPCASTGQVVCSSATDGVITSGGGFSDYYDRPAYQADAVDAYLSQAKARGVLPPDSFFSRGGRGVPDISAYGNNYLVLMGPNYVAESGTSASTPLVASMVAHWNDIRLSRGQPTLGFLNPWIYAMASEHPEAFHDPVVGDTKCLVRNVPCCSTGFAALQGWDPATGVGAPRWDVVARLVADPEAQFAAFAGEGPDDRYDVDHRKVRVATAFSLAALITAICAVVISAFAGRKAAAAAAAAAGGIPGSETRSLLQ